MKSGNKFRSKNQPSKLNNQMAEKTKENKLQKNLGWGGWVVRAVRVQIRKKMQLVKKLKALNLQGATPW